MQDTMLPHHWNPALIVLSFLIASVTSFLALELARRFRQDGSVTAPLALGGVLGYGIWAMHFIGMIAFELSTNVTYGLPLTLISGLSAIAFLIGASFYMVRGTPTLPRILVSGVIAGIGICLMHYLGMAAMQANAVTSYLPVPFALSVLIAVGAASVAFFLFSRVMTATYNLAQRLAIQTGAALVMGLAIAGMHYTGMAAVRFNMSTEVVNLVSGTDPQNLVYMVVGATILVFVGTYIAILADQLSTKPSRMAGD